MNYWKWIAYGFIGAVAMTIFRNDLWRVAADVGDITVAILVFGGIIGLIVQAVRRRRALRART
jgi:hypothetical protein